MYYILVCVYMLARACVRACGCVGVCMRERACNLANPARNAYAPYFDVTFRHYLINGAIFGKNLLNIKYVLIVSTAFFENMSF